MQDLRRWGDNYQSTGRQAHLLPFASRLDDRQAGARVDYGMRPIRGERFRSDLAPDFRGAARTALGIDPRQHERAQAAFDGIFSRLQGAIDDAMKDKSLSPDQRAAAVRGLRERQSLEANAARKQIMDEEKSAAKARRRLQPRRKASHHGKH